MLTLAVNVRMDERFYTTISSCWICGSDEDCSEGPSYFGNDELQLEELDALAREVTSADIASSDGGSSDDMPDSN